MIVLVNCMLSVLCLQKLWRLLVHYKDVLQCMYVRMYVCMHVRTYVCMHIIYFLQEKQNLKNQVISLEGEKSKLEHCKIEAEKLRTENRSLTERNVGLQGECQHLVNQLYQMSEEDRLVNVPRLALNC